MNSAVSKTNMASQKGGPYRVMVVDDSAIIRGFLCRYLSEDPDIEVVTTANNGAVALRQLEANDIEVVVLDIEMPVMDGLTALPKMIDMIPDIQIVMASTLTRKNAEVSLRSLQMGAVDYVPKPETARSVNANIDFRRELVDKVKAWASRRRKKRGENLPADDGLKKPGHGVASASGRSATVITPRAARPVAGFVTAKRPAAPVTVVSSRTVPKEDPIKDAPQQKDIKLRTGSFRRPKVLLVGSSTGGPQALMKFFGEFKRPPAVPILITQHMPSTFTAILAEHLGQATGWPSQEARDGMLVKPGEIYVAPGGKHMEIYADEGVLKAKLTDDPPENFCRPAVDPLFRSAAALFGENVLAVVLTGMGHDGLKGARELTRVGATVFAQDEATSVVWGMPGAVATAGLCTEVLPLIELGQATASRLQGGVS